MLLKKLFELVFIPQNADFRGLKVLNVLADKIVQRGLTPVITSLRVQLMKDIPITSLVDLLIKYIQKLIVVVLLIRDDVGILSEDLGFELMMAELFGAEDRFVLTIHFAINIIRAVRYIILD